MEDNFCSRHKDIEETYRILKDNRKFLKRVFASKLSYILIPIIILAVGGWVGWVSDGIYAQNTEKEKLATITKEIKELKEESRERGEKHDFQRTMDKKEIKEDNEKRDERERKNQEKIVDMLMDIQKQIKK